MQPAATLEEKTDQRYFVVSSCPAAITVEASETTRRAGVLLNVTGTEKLHHLTLPIGHTQWSVKDNSDCAVDIDVTGEYLINSLLSLVMLHV